MKSPNWLLKGCASIPHTNSLFPSSSNVPMAPHNSIMLVLLLAGAGDYLWSSYGIMVSSMRVPLTTVT